MRMVVYPRLFPASQCVNF